MAAFEKVLSGIPQMDTASDYIRLGDNVVWQVKKDTENVSIPERLPTERVLIIL